MTSSTEWRRLIADGGVAHDHDPVLAVQMAVLVGQSTSDGGLRLVGPPDGTPVDAARAARMAWWRASEESGIEAPRDLLTGHEVPHCHGRYAPHTRRYGA